MNFASSDIRSGVHGGSNVSSTSTASTPGRAATASWMLSLIIGPAGQAVEVLVERALTVGCGFAHPEPAAMSLLVLDCEHDVDDERVFVLDAHHPRDEVDTFEHHRPALGKRALDRRLGADEDVASLIE